MLKILFNVFPLVDHLYIYQNFEYNFYDFLRWFIKNPFKRNLQKKHRIVWSAKAKILFIISFILLLLDSSLTSLYLSKSFSLTPFLVLIKSLYSPLFLIASKILIWPLEYYQKQKILTATKNKLSNLPNLKVVAITGSFGKTSTKDILYTLLWKRFYVVKTPKSFNTPLGISQTILEDVKKTTDVFICEVGAYKIGEIKKITKLIKPSIGIITAIAPQHLERFGSIENIALAKFELPQSLPPDGTAILNSNYEQNKKLSPTLNSKVIFYGDINDKYYANNIESKFNKTSFTLHTPAGKTEIVIPVIGEHHVENFLAASVAALNLGLTLTEIKERAKLLLPTPHRLEIKKQGNLTIIDNTYNTNPKSARASLKLLKEIAGSQKIIITPGLIELGEESAKENQLFAEDAAKVVDHFIVVGESFKKDLVRGLRNSSISAEHIHQVSSPQEGIRLLSKIGKPGSVVLLENDLPDQYF